jgi:chromosome segregation ATPase
MSRRGELEQLRAHVIALQAQQNALQADMHKHREEINRKVESLMRSERRARQAARDAIETTRRVLKEKGAVTGALEHVVGVPLEDLPADRLATMGLRKAGESQ